MKANDEDRLSDEEVLAQMSTFVFAAQDTTSGALCAVLQELATHPDAQERLRREVTQARSRFLHGEVPYDELNELPFLDAVCRETLRL
jgi:cytochrome P450